MMIRAEKLSENILNMEKHIFHVLNDLLKKPEDEFAFLLVNYSPLFYWLLGVLFTQNFGLK